ncbi:PREDICTED: uncharacterized protein LOC108564829 [Nicrophorus vespilloides]|uniref:Uncharacterized protein LOC108564829 n=1 Tax=Nicrophorus vespilloides TaxID=110193 RepID=A0ABM1MY25_NICVS|nr:PREDICTED: uncharacterized protein LOC108564829 [Nicrophorus vespilloides]
MDTAKKSKAHSHFLVSYEKNSFTYYSIIKSSEVISPRKFSFKEPVYVRLPDVIALCKILMTSNDVTELMSIVVNMEKHYHAVVERFEAKKREIQEARNEPSIRQDEDRIITFGPNGTKISAVHMSRIYWNDYKAATCNLLYAVFTEETLATHTLTGRIRPKPQLDPKKVEDISAIVKEKCGVRILEVHEVIAKRCNALHMKYLRRMEKLDQENDQ